MDGNAMKTSLENITFFICAYFAIISPRSTSTEMANYPGTKLVQVKRENETFTVVCSRSPQNLEFGYFTMLFVEDGKEMYQNLNARTE